MSFTPPSPPWPGQPYGYQPQPLQPKRSGWTAGAIVAIAGSALLIVGSLLDWMVLESGFGEVSVGGMDTDDGKLTLAAGVLALTMFLIGAGTATIAVHIVGAVAAVGGGAVAAIDIADVHDKAADVSTEFLSASVGIGLYVCALGAVAALVGGVIAAATNPRCAAVPSRRRSSGEVG